MIIIPAIDIKDNKCVRLSQGDFNRIKTYPYEPLNMAEKWQQLGAKLIHIVDLDGAETGVSKNEKIIFDILKNIKIPVEIGGGIRSIDKVERLVRAGADKIVLGTSAVEDKNFIKYLADNYEDKIVVSIDALNGRVAIRGWKMLCDLDSLELCKELENLGVRTILYTDISRDGMLLGPNFKLYEELVLKTSLNIIASGGISSMEDVKGLKAMNLWGAIIGKALYEEKLDFREVLSC